MKKLFQVISLTIGMIALYSALKTTQDPALSYTIAAGNFALFLGWYNE